jgi:hypothetical protein
MPVDCDPLIADDFVFPRRPENRPALARIGYRVATYPEFVEFLTRRIDRAVELRAWTHRAPDDPGIALLQGAAILGDILTFYQERYANEAFLRTATWRESVAALTRLLGYRLAPGLGGRATFAFEVKGDAPVEIPAGLGLRVDLEELEDPAEFLTTEAVTAWPHLSRFHLYRPRQWGAGLAAGASRLEIASVGGSDAQADLDALGLKKGDRLILVPAEPAWTTTGTSFSATQAEPQVVKVKEVRSRLGRTVVELEAPLAAGWAPPVTAYRLGRAFHHFGHTAPATFARNLTDASGKITGAREVSTGFLRHTAWECWDTGASIGLPNDLLPLDQEVGDLAPGGRVIVQAQVRDGTSGAPKALTVVRTVAGVRAAALGFGPTSGTSTFLTLDAPVAVGGSGLELMADVREMQVHEVTSPPLALRPEAHFSGAAFTTGADALDYHGTLAEARRLAGRRLLLQRPNGLPIELTCTNESDDFVLPAGAAADERRMWTLSFDRPPAPLTRADFDEDAPTVDVFGNLAEATQGKDEGEVALGNGDARARWQTFKLPKAPLTYLPAPGATPPHAPELELRVQGRLWARVDSFFGRGPAEEVYVVREDADGESYVQFGDGETGARLPSGVKNVSARYRSGTGAFGPLKPKATPTAAKRIEGLDKVQLPGVVTGGAAPEAADRAREAAPGRVQSLGRMVSLRDYETEVLGIGGVTTAVAAWALLDGVPTLVLRVLLRAGREAEFEAVRATIQSYERCRGADRFAVRVEQAFLRWAFLDLRYAHDPRLRSDDVEAAIRAALGLAGDEAAERTGVFGLRRRRLGEREYAERIEGAVQQVPGVSWCRVVALGSFATGAADPEEIPLPTAPRPLAALLVPAENELLQLHPAHLTRVSAPPPAAGDCACTGRRRASRSTIGCRRSTASGTRSSSRRGSSAPTWRRWRRRSARCTRASRRSTPTSSSTPATTGSSRTSRTCSAPPTSRATRARCARTWRTRSRCGGGRGRWGRWSASPPT